MRGIFGFLMGVDEDLARDCMRWIVVGIRERRSSISLCEPGSSWIPPIYRGVFSSTGIATINVCRHFVSTADFLTLCDYDRDEVQRLTFFGAG